MTTVQNHQSLIADICGEAVCRCRQNNTNLHAKYYRMVLLARFLLITHPNLWRWKDRNDIQYITCPTCGAADYYQHQTDCLFKQLCNPHSCRQHQCNKQSQTEGEEEEVRCIHLFLRQQWLQTKTDVALEMGHHPSHILMAYLRHYPPSFTAVHYRHAGELVVFLLDLEEQKTPTWDDVSELIATWFQPPIPSSITRKGQALFKLNGAIPGSAAVRNTVRVRQSVSNTPAAAITTEDKYKQTLLNEAFQLYLPTRCKVCFRTEANILTLECGHLFLCHNCARNQEKCPVCGEVIRTRVTIYRC